MPCEITSIGQKEMFLPSYYEPKTLVLEERRPSPKRGLNSYEGGIRESHGRDKPRIFWGIRKYVIPARIYEEGNPFPILKGETMRVFLLVRKINKNIWRTARNRNIFHEWLVFFLIIIRGGVTEGFKETSIDQTSKSHTFSLNLCRSAEQKPL